MQNVNLRVFYLKVSLSFFFVNELKAKQVQLVTITEEFLQKSVFFSQCKTFLPVPHWGELGFIYCVK